MPKKKLRDHKNILLHCKGNTEKAYNQLEKKDSNNEKNSVLSSIVEELT